MSRGLLFNEIIKNILRDKKLECRNKEDDHFSQILKTTTFTWAWGHFHNLTEERHIRVSRRSMSTFPYEEKLYEAIFDQHIKKRHFKW